MSLDDRKALRGATCAKRKRSGADRIGKTFAVRQSYGERVVHMTGEDQVDAGLGKYQRGGLAPMNAAGDSDRPGLDGSPMRACRHRSVLTDGSMRQSPRSIFNLVTNASAAPSDRALQLSERGLIEQTRETMGHITVSASVLRAGP
jgi:hypothetical protein